jgi:hypothetical protein
MGTYGLGIALATGFIGAIFIGISILDVIFYRHKAPSVGWRIQRWSRKNPVLSGALLLVYAMLVTHFVANPIGT